MFIIILMVANALIGLELIDQSLNYIPPVGTHSKIIRLNPNSRNRVIIEDVPAYKWSYGCAPTVGAMLIGYYDRNKYPNLWIPFDAPTSGDSVNWHIAP